jgi:hypothetical protein
MKPPPAPRSSLPGASDLDPSERALAQRFAGLKRLAAPADLRARCLDGVGRRAPLLPMGARFATPQVLARPLGWAAGVLLAIGVVTMASSSPSDCGHGHGDGPRAGARLVVVDDPSVSLFHGVESFDRLSPAPMLAWNGAGRR